MSILSRNFDDIDEFREHLSGWDSYITQLSRGLLDLRLNQVVFDDLVILRLASVGSYADAATIEPGWTGFVVCITPNLRPHWCGLEIPEGSLVIGRPGREHRAKVPERWTTLEFLVADRLVDELGLLAGVGIPPDLPPERSVLPLDEVHLARFRALAQRLRLWDGTSNAQAFARDIRWRALELLASAIRDGAARVSGMPAIRRIPRYELALRALTFLDTDAEAPLTLSELAASLGTSPRALQYAFQSAVGVSPYQYMLARKLQGVRRELVHQPPDEAPVTVAAIRHGIGNLSRLAQQYHRLFGETPSQTLSRV